MPFDRFYLDDPLQQTREAHLESSELHHLAHVMRIKEGEEVELVNGRGTLAHAKVISIGKSRAELKIEKSTTLPSNPPQILLGIPILRPSKLEWIVEKGTELGVDAFLLFPARLSEKKEVSSSSLERLHTLMISAMKQSGRLFLPHLEILSSFTKLFDRETKVLFGDTRNSKTIQKFEFPILFVTGPESGFSKEEHDLLDEKGIGIHLNENILRAETAPLAAASLLGWNKLNRTTHS